MNKENTSIFAEKICGNSLEKVFKLLNAKIGITAASLFAGIAGYISLLFFTNKTEQNRLPCLY
jgi:Na+/H+ antiporter NhaA